MEDLQSFLANVASTNEALQAAYSDASEKTGPTEFVKGKYTIEGVGFEFGTSQNAGNPFVDVSFRVVTAPDPSYEGRTGKRRYWLPTKTSEYENRDLGELKALYRCLTGEAAPDNFVEAGTVVFENFAERLWEASYSPPKPGKDMGRWFINKLVEGSAS